MVNMSAVSNEASAHLTATVCHCDDVSSDSLPFGGTIEPVDFTSVFAWHGFCLLVDERIEEAERRRSFVAEEDHVDETSKVENGNDEEQKAENLSEEFHGVR